MLLTVRLAAALRFFVSGEAYAIAVMFGVSHTVVFDSIDAVVNAVNTCKELKISFTTSYAGKWEIARGFRSKSEAGFDNVLGGNPQDLALHLTC